MIKRTTVFRSFAWALFESVTLIGVSFLTLVILARILGPTEFGLAASALVIVQFLNLFVEMPFSEAIIQRQQLDQEHVDTAFWASAGLAVLFILGCLGGAEPLARLYGEPMLADVLRWMSLALIFGAFNGVLMARMRREMQFRTLAVRTLTGRLAGAATALALAFTGFGVWSLVAQYVVTAAVGAAMLWLTATGSIGVRLSGRHLRELLGFALPWLGGEILSYGTVRLFHLLVGYFMGLQALGYLNLAFRLVETFRELLGVAASQVSLSVFARLQQDAASLSNAFARATRLACVLAIPTFSGLIVCAPDLVLLMVGEAWRSSILLVQILAAGAMLGFTVVFTGAVYSAVGRPKWRLLRGALDLVLSIGLLLGFGWAGIVATAVVWSARFLVLVPFSFVVVDRLVGLPLAPLMRGFAVPVIASAVMAVVLWQVRMTIVPAGEHLQALLVMVPLGAAIYAAILAVADRNLVRQIVDIVQGTLRAKAGTAA